MATGNGGMVLSFQREESYAIKPSNWQLIEQPASLAKPTLVDETTRFVVQ